jgi:hypothetical protein
LPGARMGKKEQEKRDTGECQEVDFTVQAQHW